VVAELPEVPVEGPGPAWSDLRPVLDEELGKLPDAFRAAVRLCYLEGLTTDEAARALGCPRGTVLSRLARARDRLRRQLTGRGITLSAGVVAAALAHAPAAEAAPSDLLIATAETIGTTVGKPIMPPLTLKLLGLLSVTLLGAGAALLQTALVPADDPLPAAAAPQPAGDDWELVLTLSGHTGGVKAAAFTPDGRELVTAGGDLSLRLWDVKTGKELRQLARHSQAVSSVAFSPDGKMLASAGGREVAVWDATSGREVAVISLESGAGSVAFTPDGKTLATGGGEIRLWDMTGNQPPRLSSNLLAQPNGVAGITFTPDGQRLVTAGRQGEVRLWDTASGKQLRSMTPPLKAVSALAVSPDGKLVVLGGTRSDDLAVLGGPRPDNQDIVVALDAASGKIVWVVLTGTGRPVSSLAFSPDGKTLAGAGGDGVRVWDVATGKHLTTVKGHDGPVNSVLFSPDGRWMVTVGPDSTVKLWRRRGTAEAAAPAKSAPAADDRFAKLAEDLLKTDRTDEQLAEAAYLAALGRLPAETERGIAAAHLARQKGAEARRKGLDDLLWALANSKEFTAHVNYLQSRKPTLGGK
jgi:WD40 repeat protein